MAALIWLDRAMVEMTHRMAVEKAGGSHGLRDSGLLDSALARPLNLHHYGETDIFLLAASYAEALSRNHPFVDGNKRVAFVSAGLFLERNGYELLASPGDEHADLIESLAQGRISREEAARYLEGYCRAQQQPEARSAAS